jgi:hypothetical protein
MLPWRKLCTALFVVVFSLTACAAFAQSGGKAQVIKPLAETAKESQRKIDEIAEAGRLLSGPAGNPECVWLGRRVVNLLWRDDMDTALRHLDLYNRFGCPSDHIQATFRCLVRQGNIDPRAQETLNSRVFACWLNPALPPTPAAAANSTAKNAGGTDKH